MGSQTRSRSNETHKHQIGYTRRMVTLADSRVYCNIDAPARWLGIALICEEDLVVIISNTVEFLILHCLGTGYAVAVLIKHFGRHFFAIVAQQKMIFFRQPLNRLRHLQQWQV